MRSRIFFSVAALLLPYLIHAGNGINVMAPDELFSYAMELEQQRDFSRAATEFNRYLSIAGRHPEGNFPNLEEAAFHYALNLQLGGEGGRALQAFSDFGARFPESKRMGEALYRVGKIYQQDGDYPESERRFALIEHYSPESRYTVVSVLDSAWHALSIGNMELAFSNLEKLEAESQFSDDREVIHAVAVEISKLEQNDPTTAGVMSALLPGAGHYYVGRPQDALFGFFSNALMIGATVQAFAKRIPMLGIVLAVLEFGWYTGTIYSGVSLAHKENKRERDLLLESVGGRLSPELRREISF